MAGEDQERFEDYLELEHFIEELQAGHVAHPPETLTPGKARIYRMAALFRSASLEDVEPRPEFASELHDRLEHELQKPQRIRRFPFPGKQSQKAPRVSRRALLGGGAAAAASMVVGVGLGAVIERPAQPKTQPDESWAETIVPKGEGVWVTVAKVADLGDAAIRFTTDSIIGYVIRSDGDQGEQAGAIIAFSAACTDMGCIVNWRGKDRKYVCPCHGGLFTEYGKPDVTSPLPYLTALPRLDTRVMQQGKEEVVQVRVPAPTGAGTQ
jgi:nitrite reductase/ring-hydroxylating ferredoxin subunit